MLQEIKERIIQIGENIALPNDKSLRGLKFIPDKITLLPAFIPLVRPFSYNRTDARGFVAPLEIDIYVYMREYGNVNEAQAEIEPTVILDLFAEAFLTRPQLQYNGNTLNGIVNNLNLALVQGLDDPLIYPPKSRQGSQYWGAILRLSIQQRLVYPINVSGA